MRFVKKSTIFYYKSTEATCREERPGRLEQRCWGESKMGGWQLVQPSDKLQLPKIAKYSRAVTFLIYYNASGSSVTQITSEY